MTQLREKIARAVIAEVSRQTNGRWPVEPDELVGLVDDTLDFTELADAILDLPEIKEALGRSAHHPPNDEQWIGR